LRQNRLYKSPFVHFKGGLSYQVIRFYLRPPEEERKQGKTQREPKEQGAQGLKENTRSLRHHGLVPFHLFFSPCKVTMTMSN